MASHLAGLPTGYVLISRAEGGGKAVYSYARELHGRVIYCEIATGPGETMCDIKAIVGMITISASKLSFPHPKFLWFEQKVRELIP